MKIERPLSKQPIPSSAKRVFKGILFDVYQWDQVMFDGSTQTFEKLKRADTVTVLPITNEGKIILVQEEQPGKKPFITNPGGRLEEGEDPLDGIRRELLEETGYDFADISLWYSDQPSSKIDWAIYTFIAKGCKKVANLKLDKGEKISLKFVDFNEFIETVLSGEFNDEGIILKVMEAKINPSKMEELKSSLN